MVRRSDIRYCPSAGGVDIAYEVIGDGPVDLVFVSGFITHLDLSWELPHFAWLEQLDGVARVITFDERGTGLSDRSLGFGSLEERADDIRAVMDAVGSERAFLHGVSGGGPMSILFRRVVPRAGAGPDRLRHGGAVQPGRGLPRRIRSTNGRAIGRAQACDGARSPGTSCGRLGCIQRCE